MASRVARLALVAALGLAAVAAPRLAAGAKPPVVAIVKSSALLPFEQARAAIVETLQRSAPQPEILTFDLEGDPANAAAVLALIPADDAGVNLAKLEPEQVAVLCLKAREDQADDSLRCGGVQLVPGAAPVGRTGQAAQLVHAVLLEPIVDLEDVPVGLSIAEVGSQGPKGWRRVVAAGGRWEVPRGSIEEGTKHALHYTARLPLRRRLKTTGHSARLPRFRHRHPPGPIGSPY